jgi:hypothetical protein
MMYFFFLVAVTVCGCNRADYTTPLSKATGDQFKSKVNEYYKTNGWGSGPESWEHFDVASRTTDCDGRVTFQQAVEKVEKSIDSWTTLRGKDQPTPPFSQGLTRLLGASTLIYLAREKKLSDLRQDDRNQLMENAKRLLEKILQPDDTNVIFLFEQAVDVCQQQFTLSPGSDDSSLKNRALCYRKNIDMIQGLWVAETSLSPEEFAVINDLYSDIFRITSLATQAHVSPEEKIEKVYPELHRIYNSLQNVLKLFLAAPAVNIQERNMQAVELATTARGKLAKVEENLSDLIQKNNSNDSNSLNLDP